MSDLNMVQLIGRLGADPELRYTASGSAIANLRIATGAKWKDKQTGEQKEATEWHRVVFFGRIAEICGEWLKKGTQVYIQGSLRTNQWQDNDGNTRYTTEIVGKEMSMLGGRQEQASAGQGQQPSGFRDQPKQDDLPEDDDIPF